MMPFGDWLVILGFLQGLLRLQTCGMASLGVNEIGGSDRLGLGKNLGAPQHDLSYFYMR